VCSLLEQGTGKRTGYRLPGKAVRSRERETDQHTHTGTLPCICMQFWCPCVRAGRKKVKFCCKKCSCAWFPSFILRIFPWVNLFGIVFLWPGLTVIIPCTRWQSYLKILIVQGCQGRQIEII